MSHPEVQIAAGDEDRLRHRVTDPGIHAYKGNFCGGKHDQRIQRLEACCRALPALWRGEVVSESALGLANASLGPIEISPPQLFVGGTSDAVLEIAARYADGWHSPTGSERFAALAKRLDQFCDTTGWDRPVEKSAQVFTRDVGLGGARGILRRLEDDGASEVTFILDEERGADWVWRLGGAVGVGRGGWGCC